ncbi:MAG: hypothetical protein H6741_29500 [Alphaproteobacteria bacterium]|nr:hypothetical protein [Alphaproteobacteria bacterium]MCB9796857.1 hypothetical protein [Alphaproteobacteria bacterium]
MRTLPIALLLLAACQGDKVPADSPGESAVPFEPPTLSLDPERVDLGELDAPERAQETLVLRNEGPGAMEILELSFAEASEALSATPSAALPVSLEARSTFGVTVSCLASRPQNLEDRLVVTAGWIGEEGEEQRQLFEVEVACSTHGPELILLEAAQDLGPVAVPCEAEAEISLLNQGDRAARITSAQLSGGDAFEVELEALGTAPWRVDAGSLAEVPVHFAPVEDGEVSLMVTFNQEIGDTLVATLEGQGFLDERVTDRFTAAEAQRSFALTDTPVRATLEVAVDGATLSSNWSYSSGDNSVVFTSAPGEGAAVEIRYHPEAPCGG